MHNIDLLSISAKSVLKVLESQNLTRFLELLQLAELTKEMEELHDIAIFAPSNEAIEGLDDLYLDALKVYANEEIYLIWLA